MTEQEKAKRMFMLKNMVEEAGMEWKEEFTRDELLKVATIMSNVSYVMGRADALNSVATKGL